MSSTVVVASCGPNPAPILELLWGLWSRGHHVVEAHIVLESARARKYWDSEFGGALSELRRHTGEQVPGVERVIVTTAVLPSGEVPETAHEDGVATALRAPLWEAARLAQRAAGPTGQVVFALTGGRWRGATALMTTTFQLLARANDRLVDVRVSEPAAEGGTGFYFPTQTRQELTGRRSKEGVRFRAGDVRILLDEIDVPRLRAVVAPARFRTFEEALAAGQSALDAQAFPELAVSLREGSVHVNGKLVKLRSADVFALYALLAIATADGHPGVSATNEDLIRAFLHLQKERAGAWVGRERWIHRLRWAVLQKLVKGEQLVHDEVPRLSEAWTRTMTAVDKACTAAGVWGRAHVVPQSSGGPGALRSLTIPPEHILITPPTTLSDLG